MQTHSKSVPPKMNTARSAPSRSSQSEMPHPSSSMSPEQMLSLQSQIGNQATMEMTNATGLPDTLKAGVESLSGVAMDDVKAHYNSSKPAELNALAYTQGSDIHLGAGQETHLPHEAAHVVQQKQGRVQPTMQL